MDLQGKSFASMSCLCYLSIYVLFCVASTALFPSLISCLLLPQDRPASPFLLPDDAELFSPILNIGRFRNASSWNSWDTVDACVAALKVSSPSKFMEIAAQMRRDDPDRFSLAAVKAAYESTSEDSLLAADSLLLSRSDTWNSSSE